MSNNVIANNKSSFPEQNYTQIPNVIFDYWMGVLSPAEFKVLCTICRKTFGLHKTSDVISNNQLSKVTGLSKSSIIKTIKELEKHHLIKKYVFKDKHGFHPNSYSLNFVQANDAQKSKHFLSEKSKEMIFKTNTITRSK